MDVFVTGGTGTIGSAVVAELLSHGHSVTALARSDGSAQALTAAGARPVRGTIADPDVLREAASRVDGVVSLAFSDTGSDADALRRAVDEEAGALSTLGEAVVGSGRPLVMVSGTPWIAGRTATEADPPPLDGPVGGRGRSVVATLALAERDVRAVAVRMPRTVHDRGRGGFAGILTDLARRTGVVNVPGTGAQRWPAVHARDAAALFRLALERAPGGTSWHAVADEGDAVRDIAAVIGRRLGLPVRPAPDSAFGPFAPIFAADQPASSMRTREALGWTPTHPALLEDLELLEA